MQRFDRASLALLAIAAVFWSLFLTFVGLHLAAPSDGARLAGEAEMGGLQVAPFASYGLQENDIVIAVGGRSVESLVRALTDFNQPGSQGAFGQTVIYTVLRDGKQLDVPITLGPYPLGAIWAKDWGAILVAIIIQLTMGFVFFKRPDEPIARAMFLASAALVSATTWSIGLTIPDVVDKAGFWLYTVSSTGVYMLIWVGALHSILLFPTPWPPLASHRWIVPALYVVPYLTFAAVTLALPAPDARGWQQNMGQTIGYLQAVYGLLAIAAAFRSFRAARDPVSRAQVRWVATGFIFAFFCAFAFGMAPQLILGYPLLSWNLIALTGLVFPITFAIAILRYRLFDIDVILNRTLVYGALTTVIAGMYVLMVGSAGMIFQSSGAQSAAGALAATAVVIVVFRPLLNGIRRGADRIAPAPREAASPSPRLAEESKPSSKLQGGWRVVVRVVWPLFAASQFGLFVLSLPGYGRALETRGPFQASPEFIAAFSAISVAASLAAALLSLGLAVVLYWRKPDDKMAVFVSFLLLAYGIVMAGPLERLRLVQPGLPIREAVFVIQGLYFTTPFLALMGLFPDGRFVPGWMRWVALASLGLVPASLFVPCCDFSNANPWLVGSLVPVWTAFVSLGLYAQIYRYRRVSGPAERQQTKWVVYGLALMMGWIAVSIGPFIAQESLPPGTPRPWWTSVMGAMWWLSLTLFPLSLAIATLRYRLFDIDLLINRTLVYGALTLIIAALYALLVGGLGALFQASGNLIVSLLATGLAAILFQPARQRLQRIVNRLMYGERDDPYAVLSGLGQRLEATLAPDSVLPTIVETVAQTLKLPYAAISFGDADFQNIAAAYGLPPASPPQPPSPVEHPERNEVKSKDRQERGEPKAGGEVLALPLRYQHDLIGHLHVARRSSDEPFTPAEQHLLNDIARQIGVAAHNVRLTADLQHSRERLVTAREEERRRIRRDLHDGLGPSLASLTLKLDAARNLLARDPATAEALLLELKTQTQTAIADIRRLVYDLRPPALDELGLVSAIREHAARHVSADGLRVSVEAPESLPPLPAAVEVAAYRIALEALTNVARHARARNCVVRLSLGDHAGSPLQIEIMDDGIGLPGDHRSGVGLASMRERAAELGGTCAVGPGSGGGTQVAARLPLSQDL